MASNNSVCDEPANSGGFTSGRDSRPTEITPGKSPNEFQPDQGDTATPSAPDEVVPDGGDIDRPGKVIPETPMPPD